MHTYYTHTYTRGNPQQLIVVNIISLSQIPNADSCCTPGHFVACNHENEVVCYQDLVIGSVCGTSEPVEIRLLIITTYYVYVCVSAAIKPNILIIADFI